MNTQPPIKKTVAPAPAPAAKQPQKLTNQALAKLRSNAQQMGPMLHIGKDGVTPATAAQLSNMFANHDLVKVKMLKSAADAADPKMVAKELAAKTQSMVITVVGHTFVLHKPRAKARAGQKKK